MIKTKKKQFIPELYCMKLAVDIGNTNTKISAIENNFFRLVDFFPSKKLNYITNIKKILKYFSKNHMEIGIASVVPELNSLWQKSCTQKNISLKFLTANKISSKILEIRYSPKSRLGADRIACALGAVKKYPNHNKIVIDIGTAITIDIISKRKFTGGIISAGPQLILNSLSGGTSLLPEIKFSVPSKTIGTNTYECIKTGTFYQITGGINSYVKSIIEKFQNKNIKIIGTGGAWRFWEKYCTFKFTYEPNLSFEGIRFFLDQ